MGCDYKDGGKNAMSNYLKQRMAKKKKDRKLLIVAKIKKGSEEAE